MSWSVYILLRIVIRLANLSKEIEFMTRKLVVLILALTVVSWAQTSNQTAPTDQQQSTEKAKCACCDKMASADSKDAKMCSRHAKHAKGAKASCCDGDKAMACCSKDGKSCMKGDKVAASCCENCGKDKTASACCGKDCKGECCSKKTELWVGCGRWSGSRCRGGCRPAAQESSNKGTISGRPAAPQR